MESDEPGSIAGHTSVLPAAAMLSLSRPCLSNRSKRPLHGLIWPKAGSASIALAAMTPINFLPLPAALSFLARQESSPAAILR